MAPLYKPVLIKSAEQAEALPEDAIVIGVETGERYIRAFEGDWWGVSEMGTRLAIDLDAGDAVMALVPIEAEEERRPVHWLDAYYPNAPKRMQTRLVTPWEEA